MCTVGAKIVSSKVYVTSSYQLPTNEQQSKTRRKHNKSQAQQVASPVATSKKVVSKLDRQFLSDTDNFFSERAHFGGGGDNEIFPPQARIFRLFGLRCLT